MSSNTKPKKLLGTSKLPPSPTMKARHGSKFTARIDIVRRIVKIRISVMTKTAARRARRSEVF